MIHRIFWPEPKFGELPSPFLRGTERALRITFHSSSFTEASEEEVEAIEALRQLSNLSEIEALDTEPSMLPHLEIGTYKDGADYIPITVTTPKRVIQSGIPYPHQWEVIASQLAGQVDILHPDSQAMLADLKVAQAHRQLGYDILITLSERLLSLRTQNVLREANPCRPIEVARIVGQFLRSRNNYTWQANHRLRHGFDRGLFYWVLVRHRLPNMWRYFNTCVIADEHRHDDTLYLGQSILTRCVRVLQARDAIAAEFYVPQSNNTRDAIMYHFDYLTLLLSGVFDAQALIAHRAYRIKLPKERYASFRNQEFINSLTRVRGASDLHNLITGQNFIDLMTLLYELRNTIHKTSLPTIGYQVGLEQQQSYVIVLPDCATVIQQAAERFGSMGEWGLMQLDELVFEPFSYAVKLIKECYYQINTIAITTNLDGMFPDGFVIPPLEDRPLEDGVFNEKIRKRIDVLGW